MTREDRRQRVLAKKYEFFARIQTGGFYAQLMDNVKVAHPEHLYAGSLDAPDMMPAGSTCRDGQQECRRP